MIQVSNISSQKLFENFPNLSIPTYQRPYRWDEEKVEQLLEDLKAFFISEPKENLDYYIGSLLLYENQAEGKFEIIDGQQRVTTLVLIYYSIHGRLLPGHDLEYNNHVSFYHIRKNLEYLKGKAALLQELDGLQFFQRLSFTLIVSDTEDNAFAFFDAQNNRGVTLAADDYLKAYHLREVGSESLQDKLAKEWEGAVMRSQKEGNYEKGLLFLFYKILYRAREWKGQSQGTFQLENKDLLLKAFQKKTRKAAQKDSYPLFPGSFNVLHQGVSIGKDDQLDYWGKADTMETEVALPFAIRQPIYKGHNFFLFTQKYHAILGFLFDDIAHGSAELDGMRAYYRAIYTPDMSEYLRHFMQLCLVVNFDVFGERELSKAIAYFDYFIGSIRMEKYYVRQEAIKNSLIDKTNNLLDVIASAYLAEEVFEFIQGQTSIRDTYANKNYDADEGVKGRYQKRVTKYFGQPKNRSLKSRLQWIK